MESDMIAMAWNEKLLLQSEQNKSKWLKTISKQLQIVLVVEFATNYKRAIDWVNVGLMNFIG